MPKTATKEKAATETRKPSIFRRSGILVDAKISFWRGRKKLETQDLQLEAEPPDIFRLGSKRLMPPEVIEKFTKIESHVDYVLRNRGFKFPIGSARFVPFATLAEVMEELKDAEQEFLDAVDDFFAHYDENREKMLQEYNPWRDALENEYPVAEELRGKFRFAACYYSVDGIEPTSFESVLQTAAERKAAAETAQASFNETIDEFVQESVTVPRQQVNGVAQDILGKLKKGEVLSPRSFTGIRNMLAQFKAMNFFDDSKVAERLATLGEELDKEAPAELSASDSFRRAVEGVARATKSIEDIEAVGAEYRRRIDFELTEG